MERLLLKVSEAAEVASVGRTQAYALVRTGVWPSIRLGQAIRVPAAALYRWIESNTVEGDGPPEAMVRASAGRRAP